MMSSSSSVRPVPRILLLLGRIVLGGIFVYAAWTKMHPPIALSLNFFALEVDSYRVLSPDNVNLVAHGLPFLELALGGLLLIGWPLRIVSAATSLLLMGFFGLMVRSYALGLQINCGCFSGSNEAVGPLSFLRDGSLLALALGVTVAAFWKARASSNAAAGTVPQSSTAVTRS
jgi:uncharacterized membrane protein YphA (DoxX/SURF4 family)